MPMLRLLFRDEMSVVAPIVHFSYSALYLGRGYQMDSTLRATTNMASCTVPFTSTVTERFFGG